MLKKKIIKGIFSIAFIITIIFVYIPKVQAVTYKNELTYRSHIQDVDWMQNVTEGVVSGTEGRHLRLEAIQINLPSWMGLQYRVHVQDVDWMNWVGSGQVAGTTGKFLRMEAIAIKLTNTTEYDIQYRVHIQDIGWMDWVKNGEIAGTTGRHLRMEAIQIRIVEKNNHANVMGIDVSKYQPTVNWKDVKQSGVDFVMIRAGFRGYGQAGSLNVDPMFHSHIKGALNAGLKVGVYFFTQAINEQEAVQEANFVLSTIKGYNILYPVAIDIEESGSPGNQGRADNLSKQQRTVNAKAFCQTIQNAGYTPMIYANKWWLMDQLDMTQLSHYDVWLAHYTGATTHNPLAKPSDYKGSYKMWQFTNKGSVLGIAGEVDFSIVM